MIRLADCSDHGRGVVDEYTADDLADDSDVEKRIEWAGKVAEKKAGKMEEEARSGSWEIARCPTALLTRGPSPGVGYCSRCASQSA